MPAPANDNFASAQAISTSLPQNLTGLTSVDTTEETGEPDPYFGVGGTDTAHAVWFSFTPSHTATYRINMYNIAYATGSQPAASVFGLYTGSSVNALTPVSTPLFGNSSVTSLVFRQVLTSGVTYYIQCGHPHFTGESANDHSVTFDLKVEEITSPGVPPANDDIANAQDLGLDPTGTFSGSNIDATYEAFEPDFGDDQPSVWYKFTIDFTGTQTLVLTKTGTDPDWVPYAEVYVAGGTPPSSTFPSLSDPILEYINYIGSTSIDETTATVDIDFVPGEYYINVMNFSFDGSWDDFDLTFNTASSTPVNDDFTNRITLQKSYKVVTTGTTSGATTEFSEPTDNPGGVGPHPSVWYQWTAPNWSNTPLNFQIDTLGSSAETYLEVFTGTSLGSLSSIVSDHNSGAGGKSQLTLSAVGDTVYKIRVSSPAANVGTFNLNITAQPGGSPPANDNFANAELMTGYSDSTSGTTVGAGAEAAEQTWDGFFDQGEGDTTNTVWYKWVPPQTGRVRIELIAGGGTSIDLFLARGTTLANLQEVQFFSIGAFTGTSWDYVTVEGGVDYYFIIQGSGGDEGTFSLSFFMENVAIPANDNPATPTILPFVNGPATITQDTRGSYFDAAGPFEGDFIETAQNDGSLWYKLSPTRHAYFTLHVNNDVVYNNDVTWDAGFTIWKGDSYATAVQIAPQTREGSSTDIEVTIEPRETYWIVAGSFYWSTTLSWTYTIQMQDPREDGVTDWDSITGTFVEDDDNPGTWVAQGGVGYGTINYPDGHWTPGNQLVFPGGWWARFEVESTTDDYIYRYGQTQQFIEIFRATREDSTYESIGILGHREGYHTVAYYQDGSLRFDTGHVVWGADKYGSSTKVRIECGEGNGLTIDGTNFFITTDEGFYDTPDNQFNKFDCGIVTYPGTGASYAPDPNFEIRISDFMIHDNPEIGVMGPADPDNKEVTSFHGYTTGTLVKHDTNDPGFQVLNVLNPPTVQVSAAEYSDGYSLDVNVDTSVGNDLQPCGVNFYHTQPTDSLQYEPYCAPAGRDTYYSGLSFRFFIHDNFPASTLRFVSNAGYDGWSLYLGTDGTLYIKPSFASQLIPFCFVNVNEWNYIEIEWDAHIRPYGCKIWMGNGVYIGRFDEVTNVQSNLDQGPAIQGSIDIGRIDISSTQIHMEFRDIATTRCKGDRPLGPTIIVPKYLNGNGIHHYPTFPDDDTPASSSTIINDGDFTGALDGAGQPAYWTSYDRFDSPIPPGAMKLDYLGQVLADSICSVVSETSGPPGLESANALRVEAVANDEGYETGTAVGYVVGNGADVTYHLAYADTISMQFWIKGKAGWKCSVYGNSGIGTLDAFQTFDIKEDDTWQYIQTFMKPQVVTGGNLNLTSFILQIDGMDVGDVAYIKEVKTYINADNNIYWGFWASTNNGSTVTKLIPGETDSWQLIDDFPATANSDQIYANVQVFQDRLRGKENDGKTHLPGKTYDYYLEYTFQNDTPEEDRQLWGAKLLMQGKSYSTNDGVGEEGYDSFGGSDGPRIIYANEDNDYRALGERDMKSSDFTRWGLTLKRPPGLGRWGTDKWNAFRLRFGFHQHFFITSEDIRENFSNAGVLEGVMAELLVYDRRLRPPNCVRPIDLSRIRFRAYETPSVNTDEVEN